MSYQADRLCGEYGAGICTSNSSATITNCTVSANKHYGNSGGMTKGGAGIAGTSSSTQVTGCTVEGNYFTTGGAFGAGMYFGSGSPVAQDNTIQGNHSAATGAGLMFNNSTDFLASANTIFENDSAASGKGGGVTVYGSAYGTIERNFIYDNDGATKGGGIYLGSSSETATTVRSNVVHSNTATDGSGVYVAQGAGNLYNNTIASNSGDGVYAANTAGVAVTLINNIIALNVNGVRRLTTTPTITCSHNDTWGNTTANYTGLTDPTGTNGNISADPVFANAANDDYALQSSSPCINAGDSSVVAVGMEDAFGGNRWVGASADPRADMGGGESPFGDPDPPTAGAASVGDDVEMAQGAVISVTVSESDDGTYGSGIDSVKLWVKHGSGGTWADTGLAKAENSNIIEYTPPQNAWGTYYFALVAHDNNANPSATPTGDGDDSCVFFDSTPPTAGTLTSPAAVQVTTGGTIEVTYEGASDDEYGSGLDHEELWVKKESNGVWTNSGVTGTSGSGSLMFNPSDGAGTYYFDLVAQDVAGNRSPAVTGAGQGSTEYYLTATVYAVWQPNGGSGWVKVNPTNLPIGGNVRVRAVIQSQAPDMPISPDFGGGSGTLKEVTSHDVTSSGLPTIYEDSPNTEWGDPTTNVVIAECTLSPNDSSGRLMHNSDYRIEASLGAEVFTQTGRAIRVWHAGVTLHFQNRVVESCDQEVLAWKGEGSPSVPLNVTVSDSDILDPYDIYLDIYLTSADNRLSWPPVRTMKLEDQVGDPQTQSGEHTFNWDGKDNSGQYVEPWTYTYNVRISDGNMEWDPVRNGISYRSNSLQIIRAQDSSGNPISDAEYAGYDNNNTTETEEDDNYLYYIRSYVLKDTEGVNASSGEVWMYDATLTKVHDWNINALPCRNHGDACDGLTTTTDGKQHDLLLKVPIAKMTDGGPYIFLLHIYDNHANQHRDHAVRTAIPLNQNTPRPIEYFEFGSDFKVVWCRGEYVSRGLISFKIIGIYNNEPDRQFNATKNYIDEPESPTSYLDAIRGAINGPPFGYKIPNTPPPFLLDKLGVGTAGDWSDWDWRLNKQKRWCVGMTASGGFVLSQMVGRRGEPGHYTVEPSIEHSFPYGFTNCGAIMRNGTSMYCNDSNWNTGGLNPTTAKLRSVLAWTDDGPLGLGVRDVFLISGTAIWKEYAGQDKAGVDINVTLTETLPWWLALNGAGRLIHVDGAIMLDSGGSSSVRYGRRSSRVPNTVLDSRGRSAERRIPNFLGVQCQYGIR